MSWGFTGCSSDEDTQHYTCGEWIKDSEECYLVKVVSDTDKEYTTVGILE